MAPPHHAAAARWLPSSAPLRALALLLALVALFGLAANAWHVATVGCAALAPEGSPGGAGGSFVSLARVALETARRAGKTAPRS